MKANCPKCGRFALKCDEWTTISPDRRTFGMTALSVTKHQFYCRFCNSRIVKTSEEILR